MVSAEVKRTAEARLRLAEGFIGTVEIIDTASEWEIRNAFSRVYYALFHACCACLLASGIDISKVEGIARDHGRLHSRMRVVVGKGFERFLKDSYERRRESDYKAQWAVPSAEQAKEELKKARGPILLVSSHGSWRPAIGKCPKNDRS